MIFFKKCDQLLETLSYRLIVLSLFAMLFLSIANIVLRWFGMTFMWIDPLVRHLVFISAFLGGSLATGSSKHIGIDLMTKVLEKPKYAFYGKVHKLIVSLFCFCILLWLTAASYDFAQVEFEYGRAQFWGIHSGYLVSIIPMGFGLIGLRFFFRFLISFNTFNKEVS